MRTSSSKRATGFTLLEVVAAIAILSIALFPLLANQSYNVSVARASIDHRLMMIMARERITAMELEYYGWEGVTDTSEYESMEDYHPNFTIEHEVREVPLPFESPVPVDDLVVEITKGDATYELHSFAIPPDWQEQGSKVGR